MFSTPSNVAINSVTLAGLLAAKVFGVSIFDIMIASGAVSIAVVGRGMVDMQKTIERGDRIKLGSAVAWMGCGIFGSPFVATIYLSILASIHWPADAFALLMLLSISFAGPAGVTWLTNLASAIVQARSGAMMPPAPDQKKGT